MEISYHNEVTAHNIAISLQYIITALHDYTLCVSTEDINKISHTRLSDYVMKIALKVSAISKHCIEYPQHTAAEPT